MELFLSVLDQLRYITGAMLIVFLLCHRALPHRQSYAARLAAGYAAAALLALAYIPIERLLGETIRRLPIITAPYWLLMSFVLVGFVLYCYETNLAGALFRTMMGAFAENFVTVLIRYLFVMSLFPDFPNRHPVWYIVMMGLAYALVYAFVYRLVGKRIRADESAMHENVQAATWVYLLSYLSYTAMLSATKTVCEHVIPPLAASADYQGIYWYLQLFLVANMLLLSVVMGLLMWQAYERVSMRNEKQIMLQMARDRQAQYEFSRENIEMINRKSHDLKHQLRALEQVSDEERRKQLRETRKAIDFYDAVVKTGNDALDTLLTEKSVYCANRNIKLSCTVTTRQLEQIALVDLYTLLGNAIDNAIESVDKLESEEKKVISLSIRERAGMLHIQLENYFDGQLLIQDGMPLTQKEDKENHGYGVKSIRSIAQRYDGNIRISTEGQIFRLQIMIPLTNAE